MSDDGYRAQREAGAHSEARGRESRARRDPSAAFDCCGVRMDGGRPDCSCGKIMRKHPVVASAMLALMGLALVVVPAGAILGIIAFFRTV